MLFLIADSTPSAGKDITETEQTPISCHMGTPLLRLHSCPGQAASYNFTAQAAGPYRPFSLLSHGQLGSD
jgi:hypothetical protein